MLINDSEKVFRSFLGERGVDPEAPTSLRSFAEGWLEFFRDYRIADGSKEEGVPSDMLLFECGYVEAIPGHTEANYYVNLTRQFISEEGEDDDAMFQLTWNAEYEPTPELRSLKYECEWCDTPTAFAYFWERVLSSAPFLALEKSKSRAIRYYLTPL